MMLAIRRTHDNDLEVVEVEKPTPGPDEVLVQVAYASVNPFDLQVLAGGIGSGGSLTLGAEATGFVDGAPVHVSGSGLGSMRDGTFAPWVVVPASAVRPLNPNADLIASSCVGIAGKTAWRAVHQLAPVTSKDTVLVLGATGGVGTFAAQLARNTGAKVIAQTGSSDKMAYLTSMGFESVLGDAHSLPAQLTQSRVSVVLDPLGGEFIANLFEVVEPGARFVTYGVLAGRKATFDLATLYAKALRVIGTSGKATPPEEAATALNEILRELDHGRVSVKVRTMPFADAPQAFELVRTGQVEGKIVLQINPDGEME